MPRHCRVVVLPPEMGDPAIWPRKNDLEIAALTAAASNEETAERGSFWSIRIMGILLVYQDNQANPSNSFTVKNFTQNSSLSIEAESVPSHSGTEHFGWSSVIHVIAADIAQPVALSQ
jgi:hypothetical protein